MKFSTMVNTSHLPDNLSLRWNSSNNRTSLYEQADISLKVVAWIAFIIMVMAVFVNCACLLLYYREKKLRSNFSLYIIHLCICDLMYSTFSMGNFFIMNLFGYWPFGITYCAIYKWAEWLFEAAIVHVILLTAVDRTCALCYPFKYKGWLNRRMLHRMVLGMYIYLNCWVIPIIVANWWTHIDPTMCEVTFDTQFKQWWGTAVNLANFVIPHVILIGIYAIIAITFWQRLSRRSRVGALTNAPAEGISATYTVQVPADGQPIDLAFAVLQQLPHSTSRAITRLERDRTIFVSFSYLSLSMTICWVPADIFWTWYNFDPAIYQFTAAMFVSLLMYATAAVNPILYQAGNRGMRDAVKRMFSRRLPVEKANVFEIP